MTLFAQHRPQALQERSLWTLLAVDGFMIVLAFLGQWSIATVLWVYWGQSVAIGFVAIARLLFGATNTEYGRGWLDTGVRVLQNGLSVLGFSLHYGGFHAVYAMFLVAAFPGAWRVLTDPVVCLSVGAFFVHHLSLFFIERKRSVSGTPVFNPYLRIFPMHFTLVLLPLVRNSVPVFLGIRLLVDVGVHLYGYKTGGVRTKKL